MPETTAILGVGNIGSALARHLVGGDEPVLLASRDETRARALADELGPLARADSVEAAIAGADAVVLALWLDSIKDLVPQHARLLDDKVVIDPSNPVGFDQTGQMMRTLPDRVSAGSVVAGLLPARAHYVKAFGTLSADTLAASGHREPRQAVLFYATDDGAAGFEPLKAGGLAAATRIEGPGGDLHQFGLNGEVVDLERARGLVSAAEQ
jgi:8-hydroxy-5-deazaflavin:NADPH oxidoreductase